MSEKTVSEAGIQASIDEYKKQFESLNKQLQELETNFNQQSQQFATQKGQLVSALTMLNGAVQALDMVLKGQVPTSAPAPAPVASAELVN